MIAHTTEIQVRYSETDAMGVVHHKNYWVWCEVARIALMESIGYSYSRLEAEGFYLPVVELQAKYRLSAYFNDHLAIWAAIQEMPRSRLEVFYRIERQKKLLFEGHSRHAFVRKETGACRPPKAWLQVLSQHIT